MSDWQPTIEKLSSTEHRWTAPEGIEVLTKIDDQHGARNEAALTRRGNLWYTSPIPGQGMYVYYVPTHWRPL